MTIQENAVVVANQTPAQIVLSTIANAAASKDVDVSKMQALLDMQKDIMAIQAKADYAASMSSCQAELQAVVTQRENKQNRSKFARLDDIDAMARPTYTKHGFSLSFSSAETPEGFVTMTCTVMHRGGYETTHTKSGWRDDKGMRGEANKTSIQGSGSTGSYLRRYLTCDVFNIITTDMVQQDNDGQSAPTYITNDQRDTILAKLDAKGKTADQLCQWVSAASGCEVKTIGDIEARWFDRVLARIDAPAK